MVPAPRLLSSESFAPRPAARSRIPFSPKCPLRPFEIMRTPMPMPSSLTMISRSSRYDSRNELEWAFA